MSAETDGPKGPYERVAHALTTKPDEAERLLAALGLEEVGRSNIVLAASPGRSLNPELDANEAFMVGVSYGLAVGLSLAASADSPLTSDAPGVTAAPEGMGV